MPNLIRSFSSANLIRRMSRGIDVWFREFNRLGLFRSSMIGVQSGMSNAEGSLLHLT